MIQNTKGAQSIHRAVAIIRSVAKYSEKGGGSLSKIAKDVDLHLATVHRILLVLAQEGFIIQDSVSKLYYLGLELFSLGSAAKRFSLREKYHSALERIAKEIEDTVFLLIRTGNDALCIDRVEGTFPIKALTVDIGARRPLGIGPGSLSLIAFLPEDQLEAVLSANKRRYPNYKNLTAEDIRQLAKKSRKQGYVISEAVFYEGAISLGLPIFNGRKTVEAAITVSAIPPRMDDKRCLKIFQIVKKILDEYA